MKKLLFTLLFVVSFASYAQSPPVSAVDAPYDFAVAINAGSPALPTWSSETKQFYTGLSWSQFIVMYTASVDLLRELYTKVGVLSEVGVIPQAQMNSLINDPKSLICQ